MIKLRMAAPAFLLLPLSGCAGEVPESGEEPPASPPRSTPATPAAPDAERLHQWTADFSELLILPSRFHGTDLLAKEEPRVARQLSRAMTDFVETVAAQQPAECGAG